MAKFKKFSKLAAIPLSFFYSPLYRDVGRSWGGIAFFYLFLVLAICWIPLAYFFSPVAMERAVVLNQAISTMPHITLEKGKFSMDTNSPYAITHVGSNEPLVMLDSSGEHQSLDKTQAVVLVTSNKVITTIGEFTIPQTEKIQLTQLMQDKLNMLQSDKWVLLATFYVVALLVSWFALCLLAFVYGLIGAILFSDALKSNLTFLGVMRISIVAMTPAIVIKTLICSVGIMHTPHLLPLLGLLVFFYLLYGLIANKKIDPPPAKHAQKLSENASEIVDDTK